MISPVDGKGQNFFGLQQAKNNRMTRNTLHKLVSGSILMLLPLMVQAQIALKNWTIEDHSGEVKIIVSGDTLEITAPKALPYGITNALQVITKSVIV